MITEQKFVEYLNYIHFRLCLVDSDKGNGQIRSILDKIRESFPRDSDGFCLIEHYCIFTNFGKIPTEDNYGKTPQELYAQLTEKHGT